MLGTGLAVLSLATLAIPMTTLRGLQLFAPFVLLPVAEGLARFASQRRWLAPACAAAIAPVLWLSIQGLSARQVDPVDFRAFTHETRPHLQPGDSILWRRSWASTPALYYLPPDRYRYWTQCPPSPPFWELRFYDQALPAPLEHCTGSLRPETVLRRGPAAAIRWLPATPPAASPRPPQ